MSAYSVHCAGHVSCVISTSSSADQCPVLVYGAGSRTLTRPASGQAGLQSASKAWCRPPHHHTPKFCLSLKEVGFGGKIENTMISLNYVIMC